MKFLFTFIFSLFIFAAVAGHPPRLRVIAARNSRVEIIYTSNFKAGTPAVFTVTNAEGKVISTQNSDLALGDNSVFLDPTLILSEGCYTVQMKAKKKVLVSRFIVWN